MYVSALITVGSAEVSTVPIDAIVKSEGKEYIFVVDEENEIVAEISDKPNEKKDTEPEAKVAFKMIEVVTGVSELGYSQITPVDSIPVNAKVVTKGAFYILSKAKGGSEEE